MSFTSEFFFGKTTSDIYMSLNGIWPSECLLKAYQHHFRFCRKTRRDFLLVKLILLPAEATGRHMQPLWGLEYFPNLTGTQLQLSVACGDSPNTANSTICGSCYPQGLSCSQDQYDLGFTPCTSNPWTSMQCESMLRVLLYRSETCMLKWKCASCPGPKLQASECAVRRLAHWVWMGCLHFIRSGSSLFYHWLDDLEALKLVTHVLKKLALVCQVGLSCLVLRRLMNWKVSSRASVTWRYLILSFKLQCKAKTFF